MTSSGNSRLVDFATGRELTVLEGTSPQITAQFSRDGTKLFGIAYGKESGIRVWDLRLIRQQLKAMGLDWNAKEFPPHD